MGKLFGTNGVRGVANADLTPELATRLGKAVGSWLPEKSLVAVGRDARTTGPMLAAAATAGLLSAGAHVVELGIGPTPSFQYYVKTHDEVRAGVVVTASHNPPEFNGIKLVHEDGTETSQEEENAVEALYFSQKFRQPGWREVATPTQDSEANTGYVAGIAALMDRRAIGQRKPRVLVDTGGGPGGLTTPKLLRELGCTVTTIHEALDGTFSGRRSEPTEENLALLKQEVLAQGADLGVAHDGDADRCIFVDEQGHYVPGDVSLALFARAALRRSRGGVLCTPVSTSSLFADVAKAGGGRVIWTAVGSPIVARVMMKEKAIFGGEENGGCIFPEHQFCRDAAMSAAKMAELVAQEGTGLAALAASLPKYHVVKLKFPVPPDQKAAVLASLAAWVAAEFPQARVDRTDGLKVYVDEGWVLVRPSGTEPIYRVFAESKDPEAARRLADRFVRAGSGSSAGPARPVAAGGRR